MLLLAGILLIISSPEPKDRQASVVRRPSSVVRRRPHSLNIFSSETTGPIKVKFYMKFLWNGGTKVCSNGPGHMTKIAAMPLYGKNLKKSSPLEPKDQ